VQQDPIQGYDRSPPLPEGYWTRPINSENKGWWQVADDWLMRGYDLQTRSFAGLPAFAPYTSGPQSAHVLWKKPIIPGGIVGGQFGDASYYSGISYEQFFDPMIQNGILFYSEHGLTTATTIGTRFINLYTGEDYPLMYMNDTSIAFAQNLEYDSPNEHGVVPYLVITSGSNWLFYEMLPDMQQEPRLRFNLTGMSGLTGTTFMGPKGEILSINIGGNATHRYMYMFNSTKAVRGPGYLPPGQIDTWSPSGTINASRRLNESPGNVPTADLAYYQDISNSPFMGIEWNVTLPDVDGVTQTLGNGRIEYVNATYGYVLATQQDSTDFPNVYSDVGYDIGQIGRQKASTGFYPDSIPQTFAANRTMIHDIHNRVSNHLAEDTYVRYDEGEEVYYAFNIKTGELKWQTPPVNNAWALFARNYEIAYGKLITSGFDGYVRAYNLDTGALEWEFYKGSAGFENAYGSYPEYAGFTIADRTVYTTADEHSSDSVLWRGSQVWAIDIDTGLLKWKVNGMYRHPVVSDGVLVALNTYDGAVYAFGTGPSKTTVSAPQTAVAKGSAAMITGSVTDQTPQAKDTPAMSDESMGMWMEYLYMQKVIPGNATGVPVKLTAIGPNNYVKDIGTATSDMAGNYGIAWTPDTEGTFQIVATFEGTESYGPSFSTTYMVVGPAAPTAAPITPTPPPTTPPVTETPTPTPVSPSPPPTPPAGGGGAETVIIAAAAVIIIVAAAAAAVLLRRRK